MFSAISSAIVAFFSMFTRLFTVADKATVSLEHLADSANHTSSQFERECAHKARKRSMELDKEIKELEDSLLS